MFFIANGRLHKDTIGEYTYQTQLGTSTVDYLLLNHDNFNTITNFEILEPNEFSDHSPVLFSFETQISTINVNLLSHKTVVNKIVWDDTKHEIFKTHLTNNNNSTTLLQLIDSVSIDPLNHVVSLFTQFMYDNATDICI